MSRMATTLALSIWAGVCAFGSLRLLHESGLTAQLAGPEIDALLHAMGLAPFGLQRPDAIAFSAILAAFAIGFGTVIARLGVDAHMNGHHDEPLAAAVLTALFAFFAAASLAGSPVAGLFGDGPGFTLWLAVSFGALLFDHLMAAEEDPEDEATFRAILRSIHEAERDAVARRETPIRRDDGEIR